MLRMVVAVLYTVVLMGANVAHADPALARLLEGDMRKLVFHEAPKPASDVAFADPAGAERRLSDWRGRHVVVNFWATWCFPCRAEMPSLDALQASHGGERFEVVTIATGRNSLAGIRKFFDEAGVTNLPILLDAGSALARDSGVMGLPVTLILNPEGQEIARLIGEADWASPSAVALIEALTAQ